MNENSQNTPFEAQRVENEYEITDDESEIFYFGLSDGVREKVESSIQLPYLADLNDPTTCLIISRYEEEISKLKYNNDVYLNYNMYNIDKKSDLYKQIEELQKANLALIKFNDYLLQKLKNLEN